MAIDQADSVHVAGCPTCEHPSLHGLSLSAFVAAVEGKCVGCSGFTCDGQCVTLACLWADNLGLGTPCGSCGAPDRCDAICWAGGSYAGWQWIANTPAGVPSPGDLIVFRTGCDGIGASGHISIFLSGNISSFVSLDQNWNGQFCQQITHNYACVLGWQHPTQGGPPPPQTCSPPCGVCSTCVGTTCVAKCPSGWTCIAGECFPPPSSGGASVGVGLGLVAIEIIGGALAWWQHDRLGWQQPVMGKGPTIPFPNNIPRIRADLAAPVLGQVPKP